MHSWTPSSSQPGLVGGDYGRDRGGGEDSFWPDGDPGSAALRRALGSLRCRPHLVLVAKERPIWTGAISFGLVSIPVRLHTATSSHDFAFHQFEEKTGQRIHIKRVAEHSGREVPYDKI